MYLNNHLLIPYFVRPRFACRTLKKPKNIIFSPWDRENIQNDIAQPVRTPEHSKYLFQLK